MVQTQKQIVEKAFRKLIRRGVVSESMLTPSTVTDQDVDEFERTFDVRLPDLFRAFLKAYSYDFTIMCAPVPLDGMEHSEPESEKGLCWIELISLPRQEPLRESVCGHGEFPQDLHRQGAHKSETGLCQESGADRRVGWPIVH